MCRSIFRLHTSVGSKTSYAQNNVKECTFNLMVFKQYIDALSVNLLPLIIKNKVLFYLADIGNNRYIHVV